MFLADTPVWIGHLRSGHPRLSGLLEENRVFMPTMLPGEPACGYLRNRRQLLQLRQGLNLLSAVSHEEALYFIAQHKLAGKGIGYVGVHLPASVALVAGVKFRTNEKRLAQMANELGCAWKEPTQG